MLGNKICIGRKRHDYELKHFSESMKDRIRINNGISNKFIKQELLQEFLDAGWKIGGKPLSKETKEKLSAANKGKVPANKGKHYKHYAKK